MFFLLRANTLQMQHQLASEICMLCARCRVRVGRGVAQWLRRCATSRTFPGSIPGGVTGIFSDAFPSDGTMALESTQPLVKLSTRNIVGGNGGRGVRLTTYHHTAKSGSLNFLEPSGPVQACYGTGLPLPLPS